MTIQTADSALSSLCWRENADLADACLGHPFVQGIKDGSLGRQRFACYVGQDAFFLAAFARAYSLAAARSPDWDTYAAFHELAGGVLEEIRLHGTYAAAWRIDLAAVEPLSATRRYTDFLTATAWTAEPGVIAAATAPCLRLYAWLGAKLAAGGIGQHPYTDWIRTYSDAQFEALACRLEALLDRLAPDAQAARTTYRYAMECEFEFFEAAWLAGDA